MLAAGDAWGSIFGATGVYWHFVNQTTEPIVLARVSDDGTGCWDSSLFPEAASIPPGQSATYYFEHGGCVYDNLELHVLRGAGYDSARLRMWAGSPGRDFNWPPMTRHTKAARSRYVWLNLAPMNLGASLGSIGVDIEFLDRGVYDTVSATSVFKPLDAGFPVGSFRRGCNADFDARSAMLDADCGARSGSMVLGTRLAVGQLCAPGSAVSNQDGVLVCDRWSERLPRGSWLDSCLPGSFDSASGALHAQCSDDSGRASTTQLDVWYACEPGSTLSNLHGQLVCDRSFVPDGSYRSQCTRIDYRDGRLRADCHSFVPLPGLELDYRGQCAPWSPVRLDGAVNRLVCERLRSD